MKLGIRLTVISFLGTAVPTACYPRTAGGYLQHASGSASFTAYTGCSTPACGVAVNGFTAAMNQLAFGAQPGGGGGDACGRCFALTGDHDPYSPEFTGPFKTIVVKVTDLCPAANNNVDWCGQTTKNVFNRVGMKFHFDICQDTGGANAFFPSGRGALTGTFKEVPCSQWSGTDGESLWNGSCLCGGTTKNWPAVGCGNRGTAP